MFGIELIQQPCGQATAFRPEQKRISGLVAGCVKWLCSLGGQRKNAPGDDKLAQRNVCSLSLRGITSDLAAVFWLPSRMASCSIRD